MKKLLLLAGLALMVCSASAKKPAQKTQEEGYKFTDLTTVPTTSVKDQHRSGTCWCYSALSFLENEILRAGGPGDGPVRNVDRPQHVFRQRC